MLLNTRLQYLHELLQDFKLKWVAMINKNRSFSSYNSRDLVYIISPLMSQLRTSSRKASIKYLGPLVIYKIIDPDNYMLMTLDGRILRGLFEHENSSQLLLEQVRKMLIIYHNSSK